MPNFPRNPPYQDDVDTVSAATFNDIENRAAEAIAAIRTTWVGPTAPTSANIPQGTEYIWFQTDGNGNMIDILSGVIS